MNTFPQCYAEMFPDFARLHHSHPVEGKAFTAQVVSHGLGPPSRKLEMKREDCEKCAECPNYRTCYDFSLAKLVMKTLLANGWYGA